MAPFITAYIRNKSATIGSAGSGLTFGAWCHLVSETTTIESAGLIPGDDSRPLLTFAGHLHTNWTSVRKTKEDKIKMDA